MAQLALVTKSHTNPSPISSIEKKKQGIECYTQQIQPIPKTVRVTKIVLVTQIGKKILIHFYLRFVRIFPIINSRSPKFLFTSINNNTVNSFEVIIFEVFIEDRRTSKSCSVRNTTFIRYCHIPHHWFLRASLDPRLRLYCQSFSYGFNISGNINPFNSGEVSFPSQPSSSPLALGFSIKRKRKNLQHVCVACLPRWNEIGDFWR